MTSPFKKILNISLGLVFCAIGFLPSSSVLAQEAVTFSVSPTIFDMTANPEQTWRSTIRVINTNPFDLTIYVDVADFVPKGETGTPRFIPNTDETNTFVDWISAPKEVVIPAEKTVEVPFTILLPADATPGGHFAAILIGTKPASGDTDETKVHTAQTISSLVFLRVSGDVTESSSIRSFRPTHYIVNEPSATFDIRIENRGNVHIQPQGEIKIFNMWGQERGVVPVNQQTLFGNVLPNSVRKYSFTWSGEWSFSDIGRYTAVATLAYGLDTRQFMTADTSFWVIPWKILLTIILVTGGFVALLSWGIRLYITRMLTLAGVAPAAHTVRDTTLTTGKKRAKASLVAPLEAGILDLRRQLERTASLREYLRSLFAFVKQYHRFFIVCLGVLLFIAIVIWFFKSAFTSERDFNITVGNEGEQVTVSSNTKTNDEVKEPLAEPLDTQVTVSVVNRSGSETAQRTVERVLREESFTLDSAIQDFDTIEKRTVIVHSPEQAQRALLLSKRLNNALLSAFSGPQTETSDLIIYVGSDLAEGE